MAGLCVHHMDLPTLVEKLLKDNIYFIKMQFKINKLSAYLLHEGIM